MSTKEMPPGAPIAIVGMSCRLSGDVSTLNDLWTLVSRCRDGWSPMPAERFSSDAFHHPNPQKKGCFNQKGGYFMKRDFAKFDAPFFHITKQEALAMGTALFHGNMTYNELTEGQTRSKDNCLSAHMKHWRMLAFPSSPSPAAAWASSSAAPRQTTVRAL